MIKTPMAASVRNVGINIERKVDTITRINMAVANNNKEATEEVTNSTAAASPDIRVDIISIERKANIEKEIKISIAVPITVIKVVIIVVIRTIIVVDRDKRAIVEVGKLKMTMALINNREVIEKATNSIVVASIDISIERKVDIEEETKISTIALVNIKEIIEITKTIIAAVANKEDIVVVGIFPRKEAIAVVVDIEEVITILAVLLSILSSI
jgi:hypothetical protein